MEIDLLQGGFIDIDNSVVGTTSRRGSIRPRLAEAGASNSLGQWNCTRVNIHSLYGALYLPKMIVLTSESSIFQIPWQRINNATEALAVSHETLANKIEEDVERPLREFQTKNREMQSMPGIQSNLAGLAKNAEAAQKKVDKAKSRGAKGADKLAAEVANAEKVYQQWDSRAPFVFEQLQAVDETRLNHLRDVLTQLETHEVDQVERGRQTAETCLNILLNVETADEIKTFAARMAGNRVPSSPAVSRRQTDRAETPSAPEPGPPRSATAPVDQLATPPAESPLPPRIQDDTASQFSEPSETAAVAQTPPRES